MPSRFASLFLTLVLIVAGGMARSVSYLCLMDGQVHSECCCKKAQAEKNEAHGPRVERPGCCEVQVSEGTQPAAPQDALHSGDDPAALALPSFPLALDSPRPSARDLVPGSGARAPPRGIGPPIFVWNCSYLI
ncbi:MAG TPA: hypothetical protein PKA88_35920 [Polyangiaceae bacterium]|nr:hypothetical protein [Polyangiaceae bacterium]HMR77121.1 hypothetical protein [Polyangiaceae bacterium]